MHFIFSSTRSYKILVISRFVYCYNLNCFPYLHVLYRVNYHTITVCIFTGRTLAMSVLTGATSRHLTRSLSARGLPLYRPHFSVVSISNLKILNLYFSIFDAFIVVCLWLIYPMQIYVWNGEYCHFQQTASVVLIKMIGSAQWTQIQLIIGM